MNDMIDASEARTGDLCRKCGDAITVEMQMMGTGDLCGPCKAGTKPIRWVVATRDTDNLYKVWVSEEGHGVIGASGLVLTSVKKSVNLYEDETKAEKDAEKLRKKWKHPVEVEAVDSHRLLQFRDPEPTIEAFRVFSGDMGGRWYEARNPEELFVNGTMNLEEKSGTIYFSRVDAEQIALGCRKRGWSNLDLVEVSAEEMRETMLPEKERAQTSAGFSAEGKIMLRQRRVIVRANSGDFKEGEPDWLFWMEDGDGWRPSSFGKPATYASRKEHEAAVRSFRESGYVGAETAIIYEMVGIGETW